MSGPRGAVAASLVGRTDAAQVIEGDAAGSRRVSAQIKAIGLKARGAPRDAETHAPNPHLAMATTTVSEKCRFQLRKFGFELPSNVFCLDEPCFKRLAWWLLNARDILFLLVTCYRSTKHTRYISTQAAITFGCGVKQKFTFAHVEFAKRSVNCEV